MKKVLLFLACVLIMQTAKAQLNDIYLSNDVVLSDNQWHFDDYSVIEATSNHYLVITPNQYYYRHLPAFNVIDFEIRFGDRVCSYKPYVYRNTFGWYVNGISNNYFYYPDSGYCVLLSYVPVFYNFYYHFYKHRHIDLRYWHWRPQGHYHHLWKPPHRQHHRYDKPYRPHNQRSISGVRPPNKPHQNPNVSKPHSQSQRGNAHIRPSAPSSQKSNVTRPNKTHMRGSATTRQTPPSRRAKHSRSSSSRNSNNSQRHR